MAEGGNDGLLVRVPYGLPGPSLQCENADAIVQEFLRASQASGQQPNLYINCEGNVNVSGDESDDDDDDDTHETICKPEFKKPAQRSFFRRGLNLMYQYWYYGKDRTLGLREKLKFFYEKVTVARVTWLDEERPKPIKEYYATLELICDKFPTTIDKTFVNKKGEFVTRILIEGQPGYGKTTFTNKFAYDWAVGEEYLQKFNLCLLQPLRSLKHRHIDDGIRAIAKCCGFENTTDAVEIVKQNAASTLLILDGLDELSDSARSAILEVLFKREYYRDMTVIATSRTGLFSLEPEEVDELHGGVSMVSRFYEKRVTILGIPEEERKKFVSKIMPEENAQLVMNQLEKLTQPVVELFKSPLFLALLAIMIENKAIISELKTKTFLYMNLSNFVIRRSSERERMNPKNAGKELEALTYDFNLFNFKHVPEITKTYQRTFYDFGKRSLKQILTNDIQFKCDAVTRRVYEYGFLVNHTIFQPFDTRKHYEPFHFSIMEFAAAYFLYRDYRIGDFKFSEKLIGNVREILCEKGETSLVPQFLVGLMGDRARELFSYLIPHAHVISSQKTAFWEMIKECQPVMPLLETLEPFIPRYQYMSDYYQYVSTTAFCTDVMKFGIDTKKIFSVCIENSKLWKIPVDVVIPILRFYVWNTSEVLLLQDEYHAHSCKIQCERLYFHLQNFTNVERYFKIFESITAGNKTLCIEKDADYSVCIDYLNGENNLTSKFNLKITYPSTNPGCKEFVEILLRRNQIQKIQIYITTSPNYKLLNDLISNCAKSDYLDYLTIHNTNKEVLRLDINTLTLNRQKQWNSLVLNGVSLKNNEVIEQIKPISFMGICGYANSGETAIVVKNMIFPVFHCSLHVLHWVLDFLNPWAGFRSVKDLMIIVNHQFTYNEFTFNGMWNKVSRFENLEVLQISTIFSVKRLISQKKILASLESLLISELKLLASESGMKFIHNFCKGEQGLSCYENLPKNLRIIEFVCVYMHGDLKSHELDEICEIVFELCECVRKGKIEKVNVVCFNITPLFLIFQRKTIDESVFKVELNVRETLSPVFVLSDPEAYVLSITLKH